MESASPEPRPPTQTTRELWLEVGVVMTIAVLPHIWNAVASLLERGPHDPSVTASGWIYTIRSSVFTSIPILYLMWRSRDGWETFGLGRPRWLVDAVLGVFLFGAEKFFYLPVAKLIIRAFHHTERAAPLVTAAAERGVAFFTLWPLSALATGFVEELVVRGYLIPRLERLVGATWKAVVISSLVFASWHVYQGVEGTILVVVDGLLYGTMFVSCRRLWPCVLAHALWDGLIFASYVAHR